MKILIADYAEPMHRDLSVETTILKTGLGEACACETYVYKGDRDELISKMRGADALLSSYLPIDREIVQSTPDLRMISIEATGYNHVDLGACEEHGVAVAVIGEYCSREVADHAFTLALAVARNLKRYQADIELSHRWDYNLTGDMFRLEGKRFGIVGLGKIGTILARRAQGFEMETVAFDPYCPPERAQAAGVKLVPLDELYATSRFIALTTMLTKDNAGMLGREAFSKMRNRPVIVNTSRGELIDEPALVEALDRGILYGAGLDVLCDETHGAMENHPLVGRPDVVLTPHAAFYSVESLADCARIACENIIHYLKGSPERVFRLLTKSFLP